MTALDIALGFTLAYEGGWVNAPNDRGGETYRGISRVHWPSWPGWELIDASKGPDGSPVSLAGVLALEQMVSDFYIVNFWNPIHGDELPAKMAVAVFDFAVNSGVARAVRTMQIILGTAVDGNIGSRTIKAAHDAGEDAVVELLARRAKFFHEIMDNNPDQKVWAMNWFRRLFRLANVVLEG